MSILKTNDGLVIESILNDGFYLEDGQGHDFTDCSEGSVSYHIYFWYIHCPERTTVTGRRFLGRIYSRSRSDSLRKCVWI